MEGVSVAYLYNGVIYFLPSFKIFLTIKKQGFCILVICYSGHVIPIFVHQYEVIKK